METEANTGILWSIPHSIKVSSWRSFGISCLLSGHPEYMICFKWEESQSLEIATCNHSILSFEAGLCFVISWKLMTGNCIPSKFLEGVTFERASTASFVGVDWCQTCACRKHQICFLIHFQHKLLYRENGSVPFSRFFLKLLFPYCDIYSLLGFVKWNRLHILSYEITRTKPFLEASICRNFSLLQSKN